MSLYGPHQRELQDRFDTRRLADRLEERNLRETIDADDRAFIEARDMFFLATIGEDGILQCSYKGGDPGFVRVLDERTLAFPSYDGNGMFLSLGNLSGNPSVGLLFVDFDGPEAAAAERPRVDRRGRSAARRVRARAVRRPRRRDARLPELPALHPQARARRALPLRASGRLRGAPQCSYKGGDPGFVRVLDKTDARLAEAGDGNGMFLSLGNAARRTRRRRAALRRLRRAVAACA